MDTANPIVVEVALKPSDVTLSLFEWFYRAFWWFLILTGFFLIFELVRIPGIQYHPFSNSWTPSFLVGLALIIAVALPGLRIFWMFKKSPALSNPRRFTITAEGFRLDSQHSMGEYHWPLLCEIRETRRSFLLKHTSAGGGIYLPKRCFRTPEDIARLKILLRANYRGKLKLRRD